MAPRHSLSASLACDRAYGVGGEIEAIKVSIFGRDRHLPDVAGQQRIALSRRDYRSACVLELGMGCRRGLDRHSPYLGTRHRLRARAKHSPDSPTAPGAEIAATIEPIHPR